MNRALIIISFVLFYVSPSRAQLDTTKMRGTIKVAKTKNKGPEIYIQATAKYGRYYLENAKYDGRIDEIYQPFPVVDGYGFPFNYNKYFNENFDELPIRLGLNDTDTVQIEVKILANGKVYIKDKSPYLMVNGVPAFYNEKVGGYELNTLHLNCMELIKSIKEWLPSYLIEPKKQKFKKQTVIKPIKKNVDAVGLITIVFSKSPFDY